MFKSINRVTHRIFKGNLLIINSYSHKTRASEISLDDLNLDFVKLGDPKHLEAVEKNIRERKGVGNIRRVVQLKDQFDNEFNQEKRTKLYNELVKEALQLPNESHPLVETYNNIPRVVRAALRTQLPFKAKEFPKLAKDLQFLRTELLNALTGTRSYYFLDGLANLEHALVRFVVGNLIRQKFRLVSVPDMLPAEVISRCGMPVVGERAQVYFLDERHGKDICLSGTAEMALAGLMANKTFNMRELPLRLAAISRCYRAETSNVAEEKGIYRVHQFTKVEMFGVCGPEQSDALLEEFLSIEEAQFEALGLDFQVLDMPRHELGPPAHRKYDVEAWFPGRRNFGELSSCSNCTDYQARRLGIHLHPDNGSANGSAKPLFVHTVNGTACAIPRTVMALLETLQKADGTVGIPEVLVPYLGKEALHANPHAPIIKLKSRAKR